VPEDRATGKRILPGFQGYIAQKRKTAKQLETREYFLKFLSASAERKKLKNGRICRPLLAPPLHLFATRKA
jgi:hypothetical protein